MEPLVAHRRGPVDDFDWIRLDVSCRRPFKVVSFDISRQQRQKMGNIIKMFRKRKIPIFFFFGIYFFLNLFSRPFISGRDMEHSGAISRHPEWSRVTRKVIRSIQSRMRRGGTLGFESQSSRSHRRDWNFTRLPSQLETGIKNPNLPSPPQRANQQSAAA